MSSEVEVTIKVLGQELTRAQAEELYFQLGAALGKSKEPSHRPWRPPEPPYTPVWCRTTGDQMELPFDA